MIRVNRWWYNNGRQGWLHCSTGHRMAKGWIWEGPSGHDYCKPCAISKFQQRPPALIDSGGWCSDRHPLRLRHA